MLIRAASIKDINNILKLLCKSKDGNFYSELEGNILKYILTGNCFFVNSKNDISGMILVNNNKRIVSFIPSARKDLSFFRLIYILKKQFNIKGYKLTVYYKDLNILNTQKYFSFYVLNNVKQMRIDLFEYTPTNLGNDQIKIRNLIIKDEASLRVDLQNEIFGHIKGRPELTLREVIEESRDPGFIGKFCFIFEFKQNPIGYGQVIYMSGNFYLVNFGIIPSYREKGLGIIFVNEILNLCMHNGIKELYLKVDNSNHEAISLYGKAGFKNVSNLLSIML